MNPRAHRHYLLERLRYELGMRTRRPVAPMSWAEMHARAARLRVQIEQLRLRASGPGDCSTDGKDSQ